MIREAGIYFLKTLSDEARSAYGLRVLTMRKWPRNVRRSDVDLWIKDAAPSVELLADWRAGRIDWEMFLFCYWNEQEAQETTELVTYHGSERVGSKVVPVSPVVYLARLAQHQPVTVLCWEKDQCHRFKLVAMVEWKLRVGVA
jgi:uncharacterized protein YeaO (DUF488 family)